MGEGDERTPLALLEDLPFVQFREADPPISELKMFNVDMQKDDMYAPVLQAVEWRKGKSGEK